MSRNDLRLRHENEVHLSYRRTDGHSRSSNRVSTNDRMQWPNTSLNDSIQSVATATHVSVPSLSSSVISSFEELTTPSADSKMEKSSVVSAQDHDKVEILDESLDSTAIGTGVLD